MRITVTVFEDTDKDGLFSDIDIPISGVYITLLKSATECISSVTDTNGIAIFDNLANNTSYTVYETNKNVNSTNGIINDARFSVDVPFSEFFNQAIFNQPKNGYISTTPRKYIIPPTADDIKVGFGHEAIKEFIQDYNDYTINNNGLYKVNLAAGTAYSLGNIDISELNGLAYNTADNLIYCYGKVGNVGSIYRLFLEGETLKYSKIANIYTSDGSIKDLSNSVITLSDINNKGIYYCGYISDNDISDRWFGFIHLNPKSLNCFYYNDITMEGLESGYIRDWSYCNSTSRLYSFINMNVLGSDSVNKVVSFSINQNPTGDYIGISTIYDTVSDSIKDGGNLMLSEFAYDDGNMYLLSNTSSIYRVNILAGGILYLEYFSSLSDNNALGNGANISSQIFTLDFGNAPEDGKLYNTAEYKTKLNSRGPMNILNSNIYIGDIVYQEEDAVIGETSPDNDGVILADYPLKVMDSIATKYFLKVKCYNNTGKTAYLYGWLDFNTDGIFDINEFAFNNAKKTEPYEVLSTGISYVTLEFNRPEGYITSLNKTFIRLRLTTDLLNKDPIVNFNDDPRSISYYGAASDGETEDYVLTVGSLPNIYCYKYTNKELVNSSERLIYTIEINNYGSDARNIVVRDNISLDMTFIEGSYSINEGNISYFNREDIQNGLSIGDLNRNDKAIVKITLKVNELSG